MKQSNLNLHLKYRKLDPVEHLKSCYHLYIESHLSTYIKSCALSTSDKFLITGSEDSKLIIWSLPLLLKTGELSGQTSLSWCISISQDDSLVLSGTRDGKVLIWDLSTSLQILSLSAHDSDVFSVAISSSNKYIASGSKDRTVKLWNLNKNKLKFVFESHSLYVRKVLFTPDEKNIISGSHDCSIKIWDIKSKSLKGNLIGDKLPIYGLHLMKNSRFLVSMAEEMKSCLTVWDLVEMKMVKEKIIPSKMAELIGTINDDLDVLFCTLNNVNAIDCRKFNVRTLKKTEDISKVCLSHDERFLVIVMKSKDIKVVYLDDIQNEKEFQVHTSIIWQVCITSNKKYAVVCGNPDISVWDLELKNLSFKLKGHKSSVYSLAISNSDKLLASGCKDGTILLWDLDQRKVLRTIGKHSNDVNCLKFNQDDTKIISGGSDKVVKIWKIHDKQYEETFSEFSTIVKRVTFTNSNKFIVAFGDSYFFRVFRLK